MSSLRFRSLLKSLRSNRPSRRRAVEKMVQAEQMESRELLSAANFGFASNFEGGASEVANDVATDASGARINNDANSWHRYRRFSNVGRQYNPSLFTCLENS